LQKSIGAPGDKVEQVFNECILVFVRHAGHVVHDVASVVPDEELRATALKVWVRGKRREALHEAVIGGGRVGVGCGTGIIERCEDAWRAPVFD